MEINDHLNRPSVKGAYRPIRNGTIRGSIIALIASAIATGTLNLPIRAHQLGLIPYSIVLTLSIALSYYGMVIMEWVILKHTLRNALIPVVTMMGLQFGFLLGGSIVVEAVFNWPGLGRLLVDAIEMRDYPIIQTLVLLFSLEFILINLVVDVLYGFINPTIRYK